jgi:hypothetical protein
VVCDKGRAVASRVEAPRNDVDLAIKTENTGAIDGSMEITVGGKPLPGPSLNEDITGGKIKYAVFFTDKNGCIIRPMEPAAILEDKGGALVFKCGNLPPGEYRLQVRSVEKNPRPSEMNSLEANVVANFGTYVLCEEWRPLPVDPLGALISKSLTGRVEAGKTTKLAFKKDFSMEEIQKLLGR